MAARNARRRREPERAGRLSNDTGRRRRASRSATGKADATGSVSEGCEGLSVGWWRWRSSQAVVVTARYHVVADLRNRMILRGDQGTEPGKGPLVLDGGIDDVSLDLPEGSRAGTYEIAIFREDLGKPLATATAVTKIDKGMTVMEVTLDLTRVSSRHYLLCVRPAGIDWSYYPLIVR